MYSGNAEPFLGEADESEQVHPPVLKLAVEGL
jgi:hypothetical protein